MDIRKLRQLDLNLVLVLEVLLEECSVTKAAERLGLGQPAVSAALGRLRETLGDELLVRDGGSMRPTPRARDLAPRLREIVALIEQTFDSEQGFDPENAQREFTIVAMEEVAVSVLPGLLELLSDISLGVTLRFENFLPDTIHRFETGSVDLWIVNELRALPDHPHEVLWEDRWAGVVSPTADSRREPGQGRFASGAIECPTNAWEPGGHYDWPRSVGQPHFAAQISSRLLTALSLGNSPYIIGLPKRAASSLEDLGCVRVAGSLPRSFRWCMQWHKRNEHDPGSRWLREQIRKISAEHA